MVNEPPDRLQIHTAGPQDAAILAGLNHHVHHLHHAHQASQVHHLHQIHQMHHTHQENLSAEFAEPDPAAVEEYFRSQLTRSQTWAAWAERDGSAVGYVFAEEVHRPASPFTAAADVLCLHHVAVAPVARRAGVGRALVRRAEEYAQERRLSGVRTDTGSFDDDALAFFGSLGYRPYTVRLRRLFDVAGTDTPDEEATTGDDVARSGPALRLVRGTPAEPSGSASLRIEDLDLEQLVMALSDQGGWEHRWLFDRRTGEVVFAGDDFGYAEFGDEWNDAPEDDPGEAGTGNSDQGDLIRIEPLPSRIWYRDMVDFSEGISDERASRRLLRALEGRGAFRRFKDELHRLDGDLLLAWHAFSDARGLRRAVGWLADEGLVDDAAADAYRTEYPEPELP